MKLKRHLKCTALLSTLCVGMLFPMAVQADPEYETREVTTYLFDSEHSTEMTLAFKEDLPTIPYIKATDYLNTVYKANDFTSELQPDGTYKIGSAASEYTMTVDPDENVVGFNEYTNFITQEPNSSSDMVITFGQTEKREFVGGPKSAAFNLEEYGIDILDIEGDAYLPLATMNDLFMRLYNGAQYLDEELYFLHTSDLVTGACYFDRSSLYDRLERPESEAVFNYSELCFMMDHCYGAPTRGGLAETIKDVGFNAALDTSDKLRKAKTYLKSESLVDYNLGLFYICDDLFDGGHTTPVQDINSGLISYPNSEITKGIKAVLTDPDRAEDKQVCVDTSNLLTSRNRVVIELAQKKAAAISSQYTLVKGFEDCRAFLYTSGDTAMFIFDNFTVPVVNAFKWSVDKAEELGMKNFVVDLSTNSGGLTMVAGYMLTLMANTERQDNTFTAYIYCRASDEMTYQSGPMDLNLDGQYDDADKAVSYDMNFAVLETGCSFSSGNIMPVLAKEMGIAVLGENSGGGGCALNIDFTASGYYMTVSGMPETKTENPDIDVDLGAKPDYELSYDEMYDAKLLSTKIHEFYGDYKNEWVDGKWYDKNGEQTYEGIAEWKKSSKGWWYGDDCGWYAKNQWQKIDGKYYFFDKDGVMEADAYRQGYYLTKSGAWDGKDKAIGWNKTAKGWRYTLTRKTYLKDGWKKIDGKWYYFKSGYAAVNEFVQGWWLDKNGVQSDPVKYGWHKTGNGWWYGVAGGWYAKGKAYTIDGVSYTFDKNGYYTEK